MGYSGIQFLKSGASLTREACPWQYFRDQHPASPVPSVDFTRRSVLISGLPQTRDCGQHCMICPETCLPLSVKMPLVRCQTHSLVEFLRRFKQTRNKMTCKISHLPGVEEYLVVKKNWWRTFPPRSHLQHFSCQIFTAKALRVAFPRRFCAIPAGFGQNFEMFLTQSSICFNMFQYVWICFNYQRKRCLKWLAVLMSLMSWWLVLAPDGMSMPEAKHRLSHCHPCAKAKGFISF